MFEPVRSPTSAGLSFSHTRVASTACVSGRVFARSNHVAAAQIDFLGERQRDGFAGFGMIQVAVERDNACDGSFAAGGPNDHWIAGPYASGNNRSGIAPKFVTRADYALNREAECGGAHAASDAHSFQMLQQASPLEPGHVLAA